MRKAEIDALVRAHKNRAQPVAFFHILRQPTLEADDHSFLGDHIDELGATDLLRWRARCEKGKTSAIVEQLARIAQKDPSLFKHEVLDAPGLVFDESEWDQLIELSKHAVRDDVRRRIVARGLVIDDEPAPSRPVPLAPPTDEMVDLSSFFDDLDDGEGSFGAFDETGGAFFAPRSGLEETRGAAERAKQAALEAKRQAYARELGNASLGEILELGRSAPELIDDDTLVFLAKECALREGEDWSTLVGDLPEILRDVVLDKAKRSPRGMERAALLEWLAERKTPRDALMGAVLDALSAEPASVIPFAARRLSTRTMWDRHGRDVIACLLAARAFSELSELVTLSLAEGKKAKENAESKLLDAIQLSFGAVLVDRSSEALSAGEGERALALLSALACLSPPARLGPSLRALVEASGGRDDIARLVALSLRRTKQRKSCPPSLEDVVAAIHVLADALN